jgi:O-acetyl-ADP-ribose deacetylase (regulator of RNase III)
VPSRDRPSLPPALVGRNYARKRVEIVRGDITRETTDAIVNAANAHLAAGAGVCGAIHRAGGDAIFDECALIVGRRGPLSPGQAVITGAGRLPCRHVIHAVGPVWQGGSSGEAAALASCYRESLRLAEQHGLESIAFPSISTGIYGYPVAEAAEVALRAVREHMGTRGRPDLIRLVLFSDPDFEAYREAILKYEDWD